MSPLDNVLGRLHVEPTERVFFGWAAACLILVGSAAFALLVSSETLFIKRVGVEYIPLALLASSVLLVATTGIASRALAGSDRPGWLPRILVGLSVLPLPFVWLLDAWDAAPVAFVLVARQVLALGFFGIWTALGDLVTSRQAKRLFAPLAAGITVGAVVGSFGSEPIARLVGFEGLLVSCAALLVAAALAALRLKAARPRRLERGLAPTRSAAPSRGRSGPSVSSAGLWRESALYRLLFVALLCGGLLSPVLYFQFSYVADAATVGPDAEERLMAFFAQFRGWLNVAMLFTQLFLSGRIYRRLGLPLSFSMGPVSYLLGFGWLGIQLTLPAGAAAMAAGRIAEEGIVNPAERVLFNLFPEELRSRASALLEGPVTRIGNLLGNGLVLVVLPLGSATIVPYAALPIAAFWLATTLRLWRAYPGLLLQASAENALAGAGVDKGKLLDPRTIAALAPSLRSGDPRECRAAIELVVDAEPSVAVPALASAIESAPFVTRALSIEALQRLLEKVPGGAVQDPRAARSLASVLGDPGRLLPEERADLLQLLAKLSSASGSEAGESNTILRRALGDREGPVRLAAIAELHRRGSAPPGLPDLDAVLRGALQSPDVLLRRSARRELRAMLLSTEPDETWGARLELLADRLSQRADRAETAEALVEVARRHNGAAQPCAERVEKWLDDRDPRVAAAALRFMGHAGVAECAPRLVNALGSRVPELAVAGRDGLIALGPEAAAPLLVDFGFGSPARRESVTAVLRELDVDPNALQRLCEVETLATQRAVSLRAAVRALDPPSLLLRRLDERVTEGLGALLALRAVLDDDVRIAELERRLRRAPDARRRDIVVEGLDSLLSQDARKELLPLIEAVFADTSRTTKMARLGPLPASPQATWEELRNDPDPLTRQIARALGPGGVEERHAIGDPLGVLDPMEVAVRLQDFPAFGRLSTQQLLGLAERLKEERYEAGDAIYEEGEEGDGLYFIAEGSVALSMDEVSLDQLEAGEFFGELSTLDGAPRSASARAKDRVRVLRLDREDLLALMTDNPALGIGLTQLLSLRIRGLRERLAGR